MTDSKTFPPGTFVCKRGLPHRKGVISDRKPFILGARIKQEVCWILDGTKELVNTSILQPVESLSPPTLDDLLRDGAYGKIQNLSGAISRYRLSGSLNNIIYSLNLTNTEFFPYQFQPLLTFLNSFSNSLLIADEVGLGKTIEAGLIWTELRIRQRAKRLIVLCPSSLCGKWKFELSHKFRTEAEIVDAGELIYLIHDITSGVCRAKVVIVSMQTMRPPRGWKTGEEVSKPAAANLARLLRDLDIPYPLFDMLIVDEAHHFRHDDTKGYEFLELLRTHSGNAIFLSATPIQTGSDNLFTLLNLLDEETFKSPATLNTLIEMNVPLVQLITELQQGSANKERIDTLIDEIRSNMAINGYSKEIIDASLGDIRTTTSPTPTIAERIDIINRLKRLNPLNQYVNRSMKRFVQKTHVVRNTQTVSVSMTDAEKNYYEHVTKELKKYARQYLRGRNRGVIGFITTIAQQQMASSLKASYWHWHTKKEHFRFSDVEDLSRYDVDEESTGEKRHTFRSLLERISQDFKGDKEFLRVDSKFNKLLEAIQNYQSGDPKKKIIIFSYYKKTITYLKEALRAKGINAISISGDVKAEDREEIFKDFQYGSPSVLLSTEVAAEGLDFQFVSCLINYDIPWNPAKLEQRIGRIDRIGQKSDKILILNFVYEGSIEERIFLRLYYRVLKCNRILGYSEEILGEVIERLSLKLFSLNLSPEEEEAELRRTELAFQNLEKQKDETEGMSVVYDMMQASVRNAQDIGRYILDEDLYAFVRNFCFNDAENSRLTYANDIEEESCYRLEMSIGMKAKFETYLKQHEREIEPTELLSYNDVVLKFQNKLTPRKVTSKSNTIIEYVSQTHPLISFISEWWNAQDKNDNTKKIAQVVYSPKETEDALLGNLPSGLYAYWIDFWSEETLETKGRKGELSYCVRNAETGELVEKEMGEILVNKAARFGSSLSNHFEATDNQKYYEIHEKNKEDLERNFLLYDTMRQQEKKKELQFKLQQHTKQLSTLDTKYEERLRSLDLAQETAAARGDRGIKGRMALAKKNYNRERERLLIAIRKIENALKEPQRTNQELVSVGLIDLRRR